MAIPAIIAGAIGLVGLGLDIAGKIKAGKAQREAGETLGNKLERNARLAKEQGLEIERRYRVQVRKQIGQMRANRGASGVTVEGSALDVLQESAANAEANALEIRKATKEEVRGLREDAKVARLTGQAQQRASTLSAFGSLLSGGTEILNRVG